MKDQIQENLAQALEDLLFSTQQVDSPITNAARAQGFAALAAVKSKRVKSQAKPAGFYKVGRLAAKVASYPRNWGVVIVADAEGNEMGLLDKVFMDENGNLILWPTDPTAEESSFTMGSLSDLLKELDQEAFVVLAADPEGNDFGVLKEVSDEREMGNILLWPASNSVEMEGA